MQETSATNVVIHKSKRKKSAQCSGFIKISSAGAHIHILSPFPRKCAIKQNVSIELLKAGLEVH